MNDTNQGLLLGMISVVITGVIIPVVSHWLNSKKMDEQNVKFASNSAKLDKVQSDVLKVEVATNSMKDQLVAATRIAGHAEGKAEEVDAQKMREGDAAIAAARVGIVSAQKLPELPAVDVNIISLPKAPPNVKN